MTRDEGLTPEEYIKKLEEENKNLESAGKMYRDEYKQLREENKNLKEELEWYKIEHERLVDKLVIKGAAELLDKKFESKKGWQGE